MAIPRYAADHPSRDARSARRGDGVGTAVGKAVGTEAGDEDRAETGETGAGMLSIGGGEVVTIAEIDEVFVKVPF